MKWFKHEDTRNNPKIKLLKRKCGIVGYAVYFQLIEIIATNIETDNIEDWGYLPQEYTDNPELLTEEFDIDSEQTSKILQIMDEIGLIIIEKPKRIYCKKVLERCDDYTQRLRRASNKVRTVSEQSSSRTEQNRIDKNNSVEINKITSWAYTRATKSPSCSKEAFKRSVSNAMKRVGVKEVMKAFKNETNAIQFLINIKTL